MDHQIGPNFDIGIHGPLFWSEFLERNTGIHGPPNQSEFFKGIQGSTDCLIGLNFYRSLQGSRDCRIDPKFQRGFTDARIHGPPNRVKKKVNKSWKVKILSLSHLG